MRRLSCAALLGLVLSAPLSAQLVAPPTVDWVSLPATATVGQAVSVGVGGHANPSDNSDGNNWNTSAQLVLARVIVDLQRPGQSTWTSLHDWLPTWQTPATISASFTVNEPGTHYLRVQLMDGRPWYSSVHTYAIGVPTPAPTITSQLTLAVNQGYPATYAITATNNPTGYGATNLPAGLSLNAATGVISGRVTPWTSTVNSPITATNAAGTDTQTLAWNITGAVIVPNSTVSPASTAVGQPVTLTRAGSANFGIAWTENTVWRPDGTPQALGNLPPGTQSYTPDAGPGAYAYQVRIVDNSAYNYVDQWISFTVTGVAAPTGLQAGSVGSYSVALVWNAASGATGYNLYRDGVKLNASPLAATSYTDATAQPGATYTYTVRAIGEGGVESPAAALTVTTAAAMEVFTPLP